MDDDAAHRRGSAEEALRAQEEARLLQEHRAEQAKLAEARQKLRVAERTATRCRRLSRTRALGGTGAVSALLGGLGWHLANRQDASWYPPVDIACAVLATLSAAVAVTAWVSLWAEYGTGRAEAQLELAREAFRSVAAYANPSLGWRRRLYREEVADIVGQYKADSRKYRRVHNVLQSLIMAGSAATTTLAALDSGYPARWHSFTLTGVGFAITLAAMFAGYYKYRERSYFLQQTADAIEEEAYALALGVGAYQEFGSDEEDLALARFTQRVEDLRNEQRRRQQQLDQPAEQTGHHQQAQA
ncbi:hypothetical protein GCM10010430_80950 [Kitasatospora cystarginea]|uniref:DUF4231 domain-containing protein n=1 Tax=Kitasatospora cystarginea TaxID=58350 RepID=A0ABN3F324_9ACTN